ncbi:MAG TPA: methyltransferase [Streptosporangiaceae bacterium]|nr:methyltransferase [Streptosporangiaceae bacterium]
MTGRDGGPTAGRGAGPGFADRARLMQIMSSPWLAQCCYALAKTGIPDLLADGPRAAADLAGESGTHPRALHRMLRALASAGLVEEPARGVFGLTPLTQLLTSGAARSGRPSAIMFGEEVFRSFTEIEYTLRTGKPAFEKVYGQPFYDYLAEHPAAAETFAAAMGGAPVPQALAACDLTGVRTVADVGGGNGGLLTRVLRAYPDARGILVDLPEAVRQARDRLTAAGLADRVDFVEGSFFDGVPAGADVYVLARVLHNWDDADAEALLRRVRGAMAPGARLLVLEQLLEPAGTPDDAGDSAATGGAAGGAAGHGFAQGQIMDLLILLTLPGCDRTEAEYRSLLAAAGLDAVSVCPPPLRAPGAESVLEAVPAPARSRPARP